MLFRFWYFELVLSITIKMLLLLLTFNTPVTVMWKDLDTTTRPLFVSCKSTKEPFIWAVTRQRLSLRPRWASSQSSKSEFLFLLLNEPLAGSDVETELAHQPRVLFSSFDEFF